MVNPINAMWELAGCMGAEANELLYQKVWYLGRAFQMFRCWLPRQGLCFPEPTYLTRVVPCRLPSKQLCFPCGKAIFDSRMASNCWKSLFVIVKLYDAIRGSLLNVLYRECSLVRALYSGSCMLVLGDDQKLVP